jgi:hypothetical protein
MTPAVTHSAGLSETSDADGGGSEARTITAALSDGPLRGTRIETQIVAGRPPSTLDVPADDSSTYRYCLAQLTQSGPSASYSFLYRL